LNADEGKKEKLFLWLLTVKQALFRYLQSAKRKLNWYKDSNKELKENQFLLFLTIYL